MHPAKPALPPAPKLIKVTVTAVKTTSESYTIVCTPEKIPVHELSIINFQLVPPTPADVQFTDIIVKHPSDLNQLSHPSVSTDGKMLTLSDVHTVQGDIEVFLHVTDAGKGHHKFDPQIRNEPHR